MIVRQRFEDRRKRRRARSRFGDGRRTVLALVESGLAFTFLLAVVGSVSLTVALLAKVASRADIF